MVTNYYFDANIDIINFEDKYSLYIKTVQYKRKVVKVLINNIFYHIGEYEFWGDNSKKIEYLMYNDKGISILSKENNEFEIKELFDIEKCSYVLGSQEERLEEFNKLFCTEYKKELLKKK